MAGEIQSTDHVRLIRAGWKRMKSGPNRGKWKSPYTLRSYRTHEQAVRCEILRGPDTDR